MGAKTTQNGSLMIPGRKFITAPWTHYNETENNKKKRQQEVHLFMMQSNTTASKYLNHTTKTEHCKLNQWVCFLYWIHYIMYVTSEHESSPSREVKLSCTNSPACRLLFPVLTLTMTESQCLMLTASAVGTPPAPEPSGPASAPLLPLLTATVMARLSSSPEMGIWVPFSVRNSMDATLVETV